MTGLAEEEEEGQEEGGDVIVAKQSPTTITRLIGRRRHKISKEDSQLRKVSFKELLLLNKPDWPLVLIGVILSAVAGCLFPLMAVLFGEILRVRQRTFPYPHTSPHAHLTDTFPHRFLV